jgi:hypothetical protein
MLENNRVTIKNNFPAFIIYFFIQAKISENIRILNIAIWTSFRNHFLVDIIFYLTFLRSENYQKTIETHCCPVKSIRKRYNAWYISSLRDFTSIGLFLYSTNISPLTGLSRRDKILVENKLEES